MASENWDGVIEDTMSNLREEYPWLNDGYADRVKTYLVNICSSGYMRKYSENTLARKTSLEALADGYCDGYCSATDGDYPSSPEYAKTDILDETRFGSAMSREFGSAYPAHIVARTLLYMEDTAWDLEDIFQSDKEEYGRIEKLAFDSARAFARGMADGMSDVAEGKASHSGISLAMLHSVTVQGVATATGTFLAGEEESELTDIEDECTGETVTVAVPSWMPYEALSAENGEIRVSMSLDDFQEMLSERDSAAAAQEFNQEAALEGLAIALDTIPSDGIELNIEQMGMELPSVGDIDGELAELCRANANATLEFCKERVVPRSGCFRATQDDMSAAAGMYALGFHSGYADYLDGMVNELDDELGDIELDENDETMRKALYEYCGQKNYRDWICVGTVSDSIEILDSSPDGCIDEAVWSDALLHGFGYADGIAYAAKKEIGEEQVIDEEKRWRF